MVTLSFRSALREGDSARKERHYLDYVVDGYPLRLFLSPIGDLISPFGWFPVRQCEQSLIEQLTLIREPDLTTGRVRLYICPECGDVDCNSVTAELIDGPEGISWQHFALETGHAGVLENFPDVSPIVFDRASYMRAFMRLHQGIYL